MPHTSPNTFPPARDSNAAPIDVLLTGATGLIGRWLVTRLSAQGRTVGALVRGGEERRPELAAFVDSHGGDSRRLVLIDVDLGHSGPLDIEAALSDVRDVFHLAAAFSFGMEPRKARQINLDGTLRVAELARSLPRLRRFVALGGYRATRLPVWFESAPFPLPDAVQTRLYKEYGAYEASKLHAHRALGHFAKVHGLPLTSVHPSTVIGHSGTGETNQRTGLADMVAQLWDGQMPALVGTAMTFVPIVCVDYLADFLASVPDNDATLGQDLCVLDSATPNLPDLVREMGAHLGVKAPHRILSKRLVAALPEALSGVDKETLTFLSEDRYDTGSAEAHAKHARLNMPSWRASLHRWLDYLVATRFLNDESRSGRFVSCGDSQTYVEGDVTSADTLFLHGLPWDGESGRALAEAMPGETFVRPDLPGLGRSSQSEQPFERWLEALLETRTRPVKIIAHSLSCGIALRYAQRRPERVSELVLISPFFLQRAAPIWMRCPLVTSRLLRMGSEETFGQRLGLSSDSVALSTAVSSAHAHLRRPGVAYHAAQALSVASGMAERASLTQSLGDVDIPRCLIYGAADPLIDMNTKAFMVNGSGHNPHVQRPRAVAAVIEAWRSGPTRSATRACPVSAA